VRYVTVAVLGAFVGAFMASEASAQQAVPPRWNYQGSAVCPDGFDYYAGEGLCISRGGYGYGRRYGGGYGGGYGQGIPPRWNSRGSAVCPNGYDFHAYAGLCLPQ
jgi:hypothetical protein